jgi:hypothetical protein
MPTTLPAAVPFEPATAGLSELNFDITGDSRSELLLIATSGARSSDWAARSAIGLVDRIAQNKRVLLFDLTTNGGELDEHVGAESLEGVADIFQFGASLRHVIQKLPDHPFHFVPAGESADEESLLSDARWGRLLKEARAAYDFLVFYLWADSPGVDRLAGRVHAFVALSTPEEIEKLQRELPDYATAVAVLHPPKQTEEPARPSAAPRSAEEFESIRVPRAGAREALIADLRTRQRTALMMQAPPLDPIETVVIAPVEERAKPGPITPLSQRPKTVPPITEPPVAGIQRTPPVKSRRNLYIGLSLALIAAFAYGTWIVLQRDREIAAAAQDPSAPVATPPAREGTVVPLPYSVAVEVHQQFPAANERVTELRSQESDVGFYIAPMLLDSVVYYRVMAGPVPDSASAAALLDRLLQRGYKTGATPYDVRATPLAFVLGDFDRRADADEREREAADRLIPAYVLEVPQPDGSVKYRVYAGAYTGLAEAAMLRQWLRNAGFPDSLVQRVGRNPS